MQLDSCSHWLAASTWPDVPTCTSRVAASCVANLGLNGVTTSPDAIKSCAGVLASATCNDIFGLLIAEQLPPMCGFTPGMLADGSACSSNEQCANLHCTGGGGTGCGKCAPAGTLGGACTTSKDCPFESTCAASVCVTPGAVSGTCDAMHPCSLGLLCTGGMCAMPASEGATCMNMSPDPCDALMGEFCNPKTKVCQKVKYAAAGESCGIVGTDLVQCSGAGQCTGITKMNFTGMCVAAAADGAACDAKAGPFCMAPAGCINGTCQSTFNCQ